MHCHVLLHLLFWFFAQFTGTGALCILPPPLLVTCSDPQHHVHQTHDDELHISCFWDGNIKLKYSRALGLASEMKREKEELLPAPHCRWYRDSALISNTNHWSGELVVDPNQTVGNPHALWTSTLITVECASVASRVSECMHGNLSIEVSGQDVHLFLLSPRTLPIWEWQPVQLGWCARLKSSTWSYLFKSPGGHPAELLIPTNHHSEPPAHSAYPRTELRQVCTSYYSYQTTVHYPFQGFYTVSLHTKNGPPLGERLGLHVQPALLHVFSVSSKFLSLRRRNLSLSWMLQPLSSGIMAYTLMGVQDVEEWYKSSYNPFAFPRDFCAVPKPQNPQEKVLANIYFLTNGIIPGGLTGKLVFSNGTLVFTANTSSPIYLTLNLQNIQVGTYIFSHALGLYHSSQESSTTNTTAESTSSHYIFYQQQSLSFLIVVEFGQHQQYQFSLHVYLNHREALFRALGEKGIEVHVFNGHSQDESLAYLVWFIPTQHPLLQCEWAFSLQLFDSKKEHLLQSNNYTYTDHVQNTSHFFPRSVLPLNPSMYTGFVAEVNCRKTGIAWAVLKATLNTYASKIMEPTAVCRKSYCREVTAVIQKPDPSSPIMHYRRKSKISLQATAKAVCQTRSDIEILWTIYKLQSLRSPPDWSNDLKIPGKIKQGGTAFHIPAYYLVVGLYLINMTMTVHLPAYNKTIKESDSVFLQIQEGDLVANIAGGYFRTVGVSDHWILDGSGSYDPDSINPHEGIQFNWYCSKREMDYITMHVSSGAQCHPAQTGVRWPLSNDPVQIMVPETLQENAKYYIVLIIRKGTKTAHTHQTVHVVSGSASMLSITCFENCGKAIKATEGLILSGKCLNCEKTNQTTYFWTLHSTHSNDILFDWASKTTTGRSSPSLHINPLAFDDKADISYTLSLKVSTKGKQPSIYKHSFYVRAPPQNGKCIIYPRSGAAFNTKFIIRCSGFEEMNGPLTYKVIAHANQVKMAKISSVPKNTFGTIVYVGHLSKTPPFFLPVGVPSENYALEIYVQVHDSNGAFAEVILQATVHPPNRPEHIILHELYKVINGPNAPMSIFLQTKDYLNLGYYIYMVSSVLNNIEMSLYAAAADLWKVLLNLSAMIPLTEAELINQAVSDICQITQSLNAVHGDSQLLAVKILKAASKALKLHRSKDLGSKELEILGSGILTGLSNELKASLLNNGSSRVHAVEEIIAATETLADLVLLSKVPGERETNMEAEGWTVYLRKDERWKVSGPFFERQNCKNCFSAKLKQEDHEKLQEDASVSTVLYVFDRNPFPWLEDTADIHTAVTGFKMVSANASGDIVRITPEVAEIIMDRKDKDKSTFGLKLGPDKTYSEITGGFNFEIDRSSKDILIQILSAKQVTFTVSVHVGMNISSPPIASYTISYGKSPVPDKVGSNITDCAFKAPYILCLPQSLLWSSHQGSQEDKWNISVVFHAQPPEKRQTLKRIHIALFTPYCLDLDAVQNQWKEGTCSLGPKTSWSKIHCICKTRVRHIRASIPHSIGISNSSIRFVAGRIELYPNPLDLNKIILAKFDNNPVPLFTVFIIFTAYTFGVIWALNRDKSDLKRKNKIFVLPDNNPDHNVRYVVTMYTGSRLGSGTTADVFIKLRGKNGVSSIHCLKHPQYSTFFRAAVDTFLLTTMTDIGDIVSIHVWHNNAGSSPDWYLSRIKVYNAQTKHSWLFICRRWFGLGRGDCKIERIFKPTGHDVPIHKADFFFIRLAKDLEENHEWLAIFAQVVTGPFTRFQRLSCCLTILLCSLLLNIMFFSRKEVFGPRVERFLQSVYNAFVSALVIIPLRLCVTWLFKYSKEKPVPNLAGETKPGETEPDETESSGTDESFASKTHEEKDHLGDHSTADVKTTKNLPQKETVEENKLLKKVILFFLKTPQFPWWCRYVAWSLVITVSGINSVLIILYGLTYGYVTSIEWFIASLISFCESVFLIQTLKMVAFSAVSTINIKYLGKITWITPEQYQKMQLVHVNLEGKEPKEVYREFAQKRQTREYQPMKEDEVIILRKRVRAQHLAFVFVKDIVCHIIFSSCIFSLIFETDPTTAFYYNRDISNKFSSGLSKVNKLEHIYSWLNDVFVPLIHNDYNPTYLIDTGTKILGLPRMRQKRAKNITRKCHRSNNELYSLMISKTHCQHRYGTDPEDETDYLGSWRVPATQSVSDHYSNFQGFTYQSVDQWEYSSYGVLNTYGTGGYSFYFFPMEQRPNTTYRLVDLQRNEWLDDRTWALILELTTFNVDVALYCSITVIFELSNEGNIIASLSVHSYKLSIWTYQTNSQMVAHAVLTYILVFYLADEFLMLKQERLGYLQTATNVQNLAIKSMSFMFLLLTALKFRLAGTLLTFHLINHEDFVPFHIVSEIDELYRVVAGLLAFLLVLKPYRYFRFLFKVRLAERTLAAVLPTFVHLTIIVFLFSSIYMFFGYLIFGQNDQSYNTFIRSLQSVVSFCFAPHTERGVPENLWTQLFFRITLFFCLSVLFVNLWRAELMWTYALMKQHVFEQHSDEAEAINFVILKIQGIWFWITRHTPTRTDRHPFTTKLYGKPLVTEDQEPGLKIRQAEGEKKETYLVI